MAALTFQQATGGSSASNNPSLTYGSGTTGGSFLVAWIGGVSASLSITAVPTDTLGNTWIQISTTQTYSTGLAAFYYVPSNKVSGGANTVQFHTSGSVAQGFGIAEFTTQATSSPLDQSNFATFTSANSLATFTSVSSAAANEEVIAMFISNGAQTFTSPGSGYATTALAGTLVLIEYGAFATSGTQSVTGTLGTAGRAMITCAISVKSTSTPAGGGGNSSWLTVNMNNSLRGLRH